MKGHPCRSLYSPFLISLVVLIAASDKPKRSKVKDTIAEEEYKCLVRATDGKKKVSTILAGKELARFTDSYDTILKVC